MNAAAVPERYMHSLDYITISTLLFKQPKLFSCSQIAMFEFKLRTVCKLNCMAPFLAHAQTNFVSPTGFSVNFPPDDSADFMQESVVLDEDGLSFAGWP